MNTSRIDDDSTVKMEELLRTIRPEPGKNFHQRMAAMPWKNTVEPSKGQLKLRLGISIAVMALLLIAVFILTTPAGSALAQEIRLFFTRSQENVLPVPSEFVTVPQPTHTPEPTFGLALVPVEMDDFASQPPTPAAPKGISRDEAETLGGFDLFEPSKLPRDYALTNVEFDNKNKTVRMEFKSPQAGSGEFFAITQGKGLEPIEVGASAEVENIQIGNSIAQFVQGGWFTPLDSTVATWTGEGGPSMLRWEAEGISVEILFMLNDSFFPAYITRDEMIALAEGLVQCPFTNSEVCDGDQVITSRLPVPPSDKDWVEAYRSITEVESLAGFDILEPGLLPEGISFSHVRFSPSGKFVWLEFGDFAGDLMHFSGPTLRISQIVRQNSRSIPPGDYPPEAVESVVVNGYPGIITIGKLFTNIATPGQPTPSPIWQAGTGDIAVQWMTETMVYSISFNPGYPGSERLSKQNLIRIAESLR